MITQLEASNFKIFKANTVFPLSKLNLLAGINGRGKSSLLQVLLMLKQSLDIDDGTSKRIALNGSCVQLGTFDEIKNTSVSTTENISFTIHVGSHAHTVKLKPSDTDNTAAELEDLFPEQLKFLKSVHFIAADRIGPQLFYKRLTLPRFISVGTKGENVGAILFNQRENLVHDDLFLSASGKSQELLIQTGEWVSTILGADNLKIDTQDVGNGVIILAFMFGNTERKYSPPNVGFGYSYILPIVVAGLIAKAGEIIIVENPEAHLHPKAQSMLVNFLARVASTGVQIFVESHSEHILNAARIQLIGETPLLTQSDISVLFFGGSTPVKKIDVDPDGGIDVWPENFFDQGKKDLQALLGIE